MADILDLDIHQEDDMAIDEAAGGDEGGIGIWRMI